MTLLKSAKFVCLIAVAIADMASSRQPRTSPGNGLAQAAAIEGKFDTPGGSEVIGGDFASNLLPAGTTPAVDAQIQAALQANGFQYHVARVEFQRRDKGMRERDRVRKPLSHV